MTSKNRNEVKPVQVSVKEVRNYRRNSLIGVIVPGCAGIIGVGMSIWSAIVGEIYFASAQLALAFYLLWLASKFLYDYRGTAWMKAFWEDDWK